MAVSHLVKVMLHKHTLLIALIVRIFNLFIVQSSFVPDEYWQSLEVAHKFVFGYGYLTWEWQHGIRNYSYVACIALIYKILQALQLDNVFLLTSVPRLCQAIFSAYADSCFVQWVRRETSSVQAAYALFAYYTCWFIAYCSTRTLINTVELNLTAIALFYYPFQKQRKSDSTFLWFVSLACVLRPTAAIVWLPLCVIHLLESQNAFKLLVTSYLPIGASMLTVSTVIDSYFHGSLVFTSFRFLWFNVFENIGSHYGSQPLHWYFTQGLPVVLGPFIIFLFRGPSRFNLVSKKLAWSIFFSLAVYSLIPHKEFRFLLPLMPAMMFIISDRMSFWFSRMENQNFVSLILACLAAINIGLLVFFGRFHQTGTLTIMEKLPVNSTADTKMLILTPCHSTPLYSHIHANTTIRFLTCEPNFESSLNYVDEADKFYEDPLKWLRNEYRNVPHSDLPTHIVSFEKLNNFLTPFLLENNYRLIERIFHSYFVSDNRVSSHICLFEKHRKY